MFTTFIYIARQVIREDADSRRPTRGIFIRDTAYFVVIQWSMTLGLCFIESQWNMPYLVWKCLACGSPHPPVCVLCHDFSFTCSKDCWPERGLPVCSKTSSEIQSVTICHPSPLNWCIYLPWRFLFHGFLYSVWFFSATPNWAWWHCSFSFFVSWWKLRDRIDVFHGIRWLRKQWKDTP